MSTYGWPEISPDGTRVAFDGLGTIYVADIASGSVSEVGAGERAEAWFDDHTVIVDNANRPGGGTRPRWGRASAPR